METIAVLLLFVLGTPRTHSEDHPVTPRISLDQHSGVYIKGEAATLTCTSLGKINSGPFLFFKNSKSVTRIRETRKLNWLRIDQISDGDRGSYTCQDSGSVTGRMVQSQPSNTVEIIVIDQLTMPTISVDQPTGVYLEGGTIILSCIVKGEHFGETFIFYRNSRMLYPSEISIKHNRGTFTITTANQGEQYRCQYGTSINGRLLWSQLSEAVSVTVAAYPLQPSVSLAGWHEVFVRGEVITISCAVASPYLGSTFYLFRDSKNKPVKIKTAKKSESAVSFDISNLLEFGSEVYSCAYKKKVSEREITSERSENVKITVVEPLRTPRIYFDQSTGVYVEGETATVSCTFNREYHHEIIFFYRDNQLLPSHQLFRKENSAIFKIVGISQGGRYQCKYGTTIKRRWLESQLSQPIIVSIADPLTTPGISLDQSTGVYLEGEMVTITCEGDREYNGRRFYFYKDSQELTSHQVLIRENKGSFPVTRQNQAGRYQCKYGNSVKTRWLESAPSDAITVTVAGPLAQPGISLDQTSGVYLEGEMSNITCIVSREHYDKIYFYKNNQLLASPQMLTNGNIGTLKVTSRNQGGLYQCQYGILVKTRRLLSQFSEVVMIIIGDLSKPTLLVDSRLLAKWRRVTFNCTTPPKLLVVTFFFYQHGGTNGSDVWSVSTRNNSASFTMIDVDHISKRFYTCQYEASVNRRLVTSAQSDPVHLSLRDKSTGRRAGIGCAVILCLILALVGLCFWKKGKSRRSREISKVQNPWKNEFFTCKNRRGRMMVNQIPVPTSLQW